MNYQQRFVQRQWLDKRLGGRLGVTLDVPTDDLRDMVATFNRDGFVLKEIKKDVPVDGKQLQEKA